MSILVTWAVLTLSMWVATLFLSKMKIKGGIISHFLVAGGFGLLMTLVGGLIYALLGTFSGGFLFVFSFLGKLLAGAIVLKITDMFSDRLEVKGFGTAIMGALIISLSGSVAEAVLANL